jgi:hypothetical protein
MDRWKDGKKERLIDKRKMDTRTDGKMDGQIDRQMDRWTDQRKD